jgi:hypothetical protein
VSIDAIPLAGDEPSALPRALHVGHTGENCPLANLGIRMKSLIAKGAECGFGGLSTLPAPSR